MGSSASMVGLLQKAIPGLRVSGESIDRTAYSRDLWPRRNFDLRDGSGLGSTEPAAIAWPTSTEQVSWILRLCAEEGISVVPFGAGSGVCGGISPHAKSLILDLKGMARWRRLDERAPELDVEAGALGLPLEERLQAKGWTIGHFPSSILCSTVGGWVAARGAGQCSGRYGKVEDMVASLELVDGRGHVHQIDRHPHGPDLLPLVIGSEGTLGVITSATFRLHRNPTSRVFAGWELPSMRAGWMAIRELYQAGLRPAVCRLYDPFDSFLARTKTRENDGRVSKPRSDHRSTRVLLRALRFPKAINQLVDLTANRLLGRSHLILIWEGEGDEPRRDAERAARLLREAQARSLGEEPARHWMTHRYSVSYRMSPMFMDGGFVDTLEVAAPWSSLEAVYDGVRRALGAHVFVMAHMSHAYPDGCSIYFSFAGQGRDDQESRRIYDHAWADAMQASVEAGGTLSHHHGIGRSKATGLARELGPQGVLLLQAVMRAFDPEGICNPGNLLPPRGETPTAYGRRPRGQAPIELDGESLLVHTAGDVSLAELQARLAQDGLTLRGAHVPGDRSVRQWLSQGAVGGPDPWSDPVDHLVAGLEADIGEHGKLSLRPMPRRATGPDLSALVCGTSLGVIQAASLRVESRTSASSVALRYQGERRTSLNQGELLLWRAVERELERLSR